MTSNEKNKIVLIGGPIKHALKNNCFIEELESFITAILCELKNKNYHTLSAHDFEDFGRINDWSSDEIALRDYKWMNQCDIFIAILPFISKRIALRTDVLNRIRNGTTKRNVLMPPF